MSDTTTGGEITIRCARHDCDWERAYVVELPTSVTYLRRTIRWVRLRHFLHVLNKHQWDGS